MTSTRLARLGLALARPRVALHLAGDRHHPGRAGTDLLVAIVVLVLATQSRALVAAAWLGASVEPTLGLRAVVQMLTAALVVDLVILIVAAVVIWAASGPRRELGRSFDLACVAILPLLFVELGASVVVFATGVVVPQGVMWLLSGIAYAWTGAFVALAVVAARRTTAPPSVASRAGWALVAFAVAGIVLQLTWLVRHADLVRPMQFGDTAPQISLPRINANGAPGPRVALAPGKVTVLDFWATWCQPCLRALPKLEAVARRHPEVDVLAINIDDAAEARALFDERRYTMTLLAGDRETSDRYGVAAIPHTVLIDRAGTVRRVFRGGSVDVEREVESLLK